MARARTMGGTDSLGLLSFTSNGATMGRWGATLFTASRTSICRGAGTTNASRSASCHDGHDDRTHLKRRKCGRGNTRLSQREENEREHGVHLLKHE